MQALGWLAMFMPTHAALKGEGDWGDWAPRWLLLVSGGVCVGVRVWGGGGLGEWAPRWLLQVGGAAALATAMPLPPRLLIWRSWSRHC